VTFVTFSKLFFEILRLCVRSSSIHLAFAILARRSSSSTTQSATDAGCSSGLTHRQKQRQSPDKGVREEADSIVIMPNYVVVQCFQCRVFQTQQEKKEARRASVRFHKLLLSHAPSQARFTCVMCGAAQSVKQVMLSSSR
jgi:hypothetical protein